MVIVGGFGWVRSLRSISVIIIISIILYGRHLCFSFFFFFFELFEKPLGPKTIIRVHFGHKPEEAVAGSIVHDDFDTFAILL